jgi:hypothetical protein
MEPKLRSSSGSVENGSRAPDRHARSFAFGRGLSRIDLPRTKCCRRSSAHCSTPTTPPAAFPRRHRRRGSAPPRTSPPTARGSDFVRRSGSVFTRRRHPWRSAIRRAARDHGMRVRIPRWNTVNFLMSRDAGLGRVRPTARTCVITTRSGAARREDSSGGVDVGPHGRPPSEPAREKLPDEQVALRRWRRLSRPARASCAAWGEEVEGPPVIAQPDRRAARNCGDVRPVRGCSIA